MPRKKKEEDFDSEFQAISDWDTEMNVWMEKVEKCKHAFQDFTVDDRIYDECSKCGVKIYRGRHKKKEVKKTPVKKKPVKRTVKREKK
jgi:hypothetical protein